MTQTIATEHTCQCGCGQPIPYRKAHKYKAPRYLNGHAQRAPEFRDRWAKSRAAVHVRPQDATVYICRCGCNEEIPWRPAHWKRPPKFIQAHYLRDGTSLRITKVREAKARERRKPPEGWTPPTGLCQCGCGLGTNMATRTRPERDEYLGYRVRYVRGHHHYQLLSGGAAQLARQSKRLQRKISRTGYVEILKPDHPSAGKSGFVMEHRYVYETTRGVILPKSVLVHHIDGVKTNNAPDNLIAFARQHHALVHVKAGEILAMFWDKRLLRAAEAHFDACGELPDLETLTRQVHAVAS